MKKFKTPSWLENLLDTEAADVSKVKNKFAVALERLMDGEHLTRKQLAERLDVTQPYITKLLRGDANISLKTMVKAARAFDSEVDVNIVRKNAGCTNKEWIDLKYASDLTRRKKPESATPRWAYMDEVA